MPGIGLVLVAAAVTVAAGCSGRDEAGRPALPAPVEGAPHEVDVEQASERSDEPAVVFRPRGKPEARVVVEVARTARQIQRGLMYREHLPPDGGMLFLFRRARVQSFWMKNTLIPLDMIFVSSDMVVVGVIESAQPRTTTSRSVPGAVSQYVVEVNAGWARAHGIEAGVPVELVDIAPLAPGEGG